MRKTIYVLLLVAITISIFALSGCSGKEDKHDLSSGLEDVSSEYADGVATIKFKNTNKTTITSVSGKITCWSESDTRLGEGLFEWSGECATGEYFTVTVDDIYVREKGYVDRVGYIITEINGENVWF